MFGSSKTILIVDDDSHIRDVIRFALTKAGYRIFEASDGKECMELFSKNTYDLIILDILMPELDGTEVCKLIRTQSKVPIIFLSSMDDAVDRIVGLELGGDDYINKPFSPRELVARVKAVLRRTVTVKEQIVPEQTTKCFGKLQLDGERFQVHWERTEIVLTAMEFAMLEALLSFPEKVFSRDELMAKIYDHAAHVTDRTIDSHIRKLRAKFREAGGEPVTTIRGVGYKLGPCT